MLTSKKAANAVDRGVADPEAPGDRAATFAAIDVPTTAARDRKVRAADGSPVATIAGGGGVVIGVVDPGIAGVGAALTGLVAIRSRICPRALPST